MSGFCASRIFLLDSNIFSEDAFSAENVFILQVVHKAALGGHGGAIRSLPRFQVTERNAGQKKGSSHIIILTTENDKVKHPEETKRRKFEATGTPISPSSSPIPSCSRHNDGNVGICSAKIVEALCAEKETPTLVVNANEIKAGNGFC